MIPERNDIRHMKEILPTIDSIWQKGSIESERIDRKVTASTEKSGHDLQ